MFDSTADMFHDEQFHLKSPSIVQWTNAVNGRFYWCHAPAGYNKYDYNIETGKHWPYGHCIVDDFGTLQPGDLFPNDWESEQTDHTIDQFLESAFGSNLKDIGQVETALHMHGGFNCVDEWYNVYYVGYNDVSRDHINIRCVRPGPWKAPQKKLIILDIPTSGFQFLTS